MAETLEDLLVWQRALQLWDAVNPLLALSGFCKDCNLHDQIADAVDSVVANIAEGFERPTDRAFARFLYTSKGSAAEVSARLLIAVKRHHVSPEQFSKASSLSTELQKMLGGLIKYLRKSDRKDRGVGRTTVYVPKHTRRGTPLRAATDVAETASD